MYPTPSLATTLQQLLKARGYNSHSLASVCGVPQPVIHRIAHGRTENPKIHTLLALAKSLDVSLDQLMGTVPWQQCDHKHVQIPYISHLKLGHWAQASTHSERWLTSTANEHGQHCFAMTLWDDTMAPAFAQGGVVIIDPDRQAKHRDHVLVQRTQGWFFRQYYTDQHHHLLKARHSDFPATPMQAGDQIIGVAVEYRCALASPGCPD